MTPLETIEKQVEAYNSRNIDDFVACHDEKVELFSLGEKEPFCVGAAAVRKRYADVFVQSPNLHTHVVNRIACGSTVIDHEIVTGRVGEPRIEMVAIYEVQNGLIKKAYFQRK